jgi:anthranilate phosphoribosyltransferase
MSENALKPIFKCLASGQPLSDDDMTTAMTLMTEGKASPAQMGAFLMGLAVRGETVSEIATVAALLRERMTAIQAQPGAVDIVGTGGDGHATYNISTCAAVVAAGAGLKVAKHGNRSVSSLSGASDVLTALGVNVDCDLEAVASALDQTGLCFMWAPKHHPAMKAWAPIRADLGVRTIFNLIGPLCNPAGVKHHVIGVFDQQWVEPVADVLKRLGSERAWVVHGNDGLDELSTTGPTTVAELRDGDVTVFEVTPEDAGVERATLADLKGGDAAHNAEALRAVLAGANSAYRDSVVLNAAAALVVCDKAANLADGVRKASAAIDNGRAGQALDALIKVTNASA